jgi:hypothetical protein
MRARTLLITGCTLTTMFVASGAAQEVAQPRSPLAVSSVTVTIEGTSKRDPFFASTKTMRVTRLQLAELRSEDVLGQALRPGGLEAFDVTIPVMTLTSPDEGVDEHIHDSLKADTHPEIRFQLRSIENRPDDAMGFGRLSANGTLTVAGVGREVTLNIKALRAGRSLLVDGSTDLLMTDFGVKPPKGLLGLLRTAPLIHVRFYVAVSAADE